MTLETIVKCLRAAALFSALFAMAFIIPGCGVRPQVTDTPAKDTSANPQPVVDPPQSELSPITGLPMTSEGSPCAVSIGNNPTARPQSGLYQADLVYEVLAEGGITRYLAIFHSSAPEKIGPVRSARPYLALLAKEWGALFAHCGGDPKDLEPIREWKVQDADEFKYSSLYWRDNARKPPDNLYTKVENLRKVTADPLPDPTKRYEFGNWSEAPEEGFKVTYNKNYAVQYVYSDRKYLRYIIEKGTANEHRDLDTDKPIEVSNVIVQFADHKVVYSDLGLVIDLVGEGKSLYLLGGKYQEGTWKKDSVESPTTFYAADGSKIRPVPGQTWIHIVPMNATVAVSKTK